MALPQELIFQDILPRVPAKSLIRFRCVSKSWFNLISDHHFIKTHLQHWKSRPSGTITPPWDETQAYFDQETGEHFVIPLAGILNDRNCLTPFASHDGLLLIQSLNTSDYQTDPCFYVCNPMTRQFMKLPSPPIWLKPCDIVFDPTIQHYKVVSWSATRRCAVFTLDGRRDGSWRFLGLPLQCCGVQSQAVVSNGALNWVAELDHSRKKCVVMSMDIEREEIKEIRLPGHDEERSSEGTVLMQLNGCLCAVFFTEDFHQTVAWVLEDWEKQRWRKHCELVKSGSGYCVRSKSGDFDTKEIEEKMVKISKKTQLCHSYRIEHVNTLVSWDGAQSRKPRGWFYATALSLISCAFASCFLRLLSVRGEM